MWHTMRKLRLPAKASRYLAVLIGLGAVIGGVYLWHRQASRGLIELAGPPGPPTSSAAQTAQVATYETFQIAIPQGWQRVPEHEGGESGVLLYLRGPLLDGQPLVIAAEVYPVAKGVTLAGFVNSFTAEWPLERLPVQRDVELCGQPAQAITFTNADGDNLVLFCLYKQQAHVIVMVAPAQTLPTHAKLFHEVLAGLQLYE